MTYTQSIMCTIQRSKLLKKDLNGSRWITGMVLMGPENQDILINREEIWCMMLGAGFQIWVCCIPSDSIWYWRCSVCSQINRASTTDSNNLASRATGIIQSFPRAKKISIQFAEGPNYSAYHKSFKLSFLFSTSSKNGLWAWNPFLEPRLFALLVISY